MCTPDSGTIAAALADPDHPEAKGLAILASLLILTTGLFALVFYGVTGGSKFAGLDWMLLQGLQSLRTPWADHVMLVFTYLADTTVVAALILAVLAFLLLKRHNRTLVHWLAAAAFGLLASPILKYSLQIPRPDLGIAAVGPYAFPSAHVMRATVLYGFLAVIIARALDCTLALARLRHSRPADPVGHLVPALPGRALAVRCVGQPDPGACLGRRTGYRLQSPHRCGNPLARPDAVRHRHPGTRPGPADLALSGDRSRPYTPARPTQQMGLEVWWTEGWNQLPQRREDIRDSRRQPLNIQYAGSLDALESTLTRRGWKPAQTLNWENSLKLLSPSAGLHDCPSCPRSTTAATKSWPSKAIRPPRTAWCCDSGPPTLCCNPATFGLWQGTVSFQKKTQVLSLFAFPTTRPDFSRPYALFLHDIQQLTHRQPDPALELVLIRSDRNSYGNPPPSAAPDFIQ